MTTAGGAPGTRILPAVLSDAAAEGMPRQALLADLREVSAFLEQPRALDREMARRGFSRTERAVPWGLEVDYQRRGEGAHTSESLRAQREAVTGRILGLELTCETPHYQQRVQAATEENGERLDATRVAHPAAPADSQVIP